MKVGDLVMVINTHVGFISKGATGLVIDKASGDRWIIKWLTGNVLSNGLRMKETTSYAYGIEVISEAG
jgi:hypothetical protein